MRMLWWKRTLEQQIARLRAEAGVYEREAALLRGQAQQRDQAAAQRHAEAAKLEVQLR